jgi:hypothetical protein
MSVEKLELKHLKNYLDCNLQIARFGVDRKYKRIEGILDTYLINHVIRYDNLKPVLRPVKDLLNIDLDYWIDLGEEMETMYTESIVDSIINETHYAMDYKRWKKLMEFLFENHFDVDDLIGKGLAIDINTLEI